MSLWTHSTRGLIVTTDPKTLPNGVTFDDDFVCPSCKTKMYYKSAGSNGTRAHFAGSHEEWCDLGFTSDSDGTIHDYSFSQNTLFDFFRSVIEEGVQTSGSVTVSSFKSLSTSEHVATDSHKDTSQYPITEQSMKIRTVRQLFNVLATSSPDDELYSEVTVKDVYCGINTKFLYTKYIKGLHLVYAEYNWFSKTENMLFFRYPTIKHTQLKIRVVIPEDKLFKTIKTLLKGHYGKHVLIFGDFVNNVCTVTSATQIVPLRR